MMASTEPTRHEGSHTGGLCQQVLRQGGLPRKLAEAQALTETIEQMRIESQSGEAGEAQR